MGKEVLRALVKTYDDFQDLRIGIGNRNKIKKNGEQQKIPESQAHAVMSVDEKIILAKYYDALRVLEENVKKDIEKELENHPIWTKWLKPCVGGAGVISAARIISEFDIHTASMVSKLTQFSGMNPGLVRGKKSIEITKDINLDDYEVVKIIKGAEGKKDKAIILTNEMVRGDKLTPGFVAPFNKNIKSFLLGVLADQFMKIKNNSPYRKIALDEKARLENSDKLIVGYTEKGKPVDKKWKDTTKGHRHRAAIRKMMKIFLKDLYVKWRTLEGLPVREPYEVEYLGKEHSA